MTSDSKPYFTRLTITGFKSFADEITVEILPGLTGIIGPNGCGKSNIVDALRWVMGESSAKALRGGDSDDLIFAGTNARSARNLAQVSVQIDNAQGLAQPPFQECTELVISRQAERGSNSTYRLNHTAVRARDIQMLFADMDSGARSSAIISQNRVSQIIEVKPEERRVLLEEAAGIKGLYVRRKDAESKLKQAQSNLEQAQLNLDALQNRIKALSEQSEHARTYRALSESIRKTEAELLRLRHSQAYIKVKNAQKDLSQAKEALEKTASLLGERKAAFEVLHRDEKAQKEQLELLRSRLEDQKLQMEIAQNNLSHIQKLWNERREQFNELENTLEAKNNQLTTLKAEEAGCNNDMAILKEGYDPSLDLSVEKQKIDTQEKALDDSKSAYDKAKEDYHQATLRYETAKNQCDNLHQHLKQSQDTLDQIQTELHKNEQICLNSSLVKEAEEHVERVRQTVKKAVEDKTALSNICQEQKIAVEKAKSVLEANLRRQKHLSTQRDLISERLKTLDMRRQTTVSEQKALEESALSPQELERQKHALSEARACFEKADSHEKALNESKEKQEEIWLKARTAQKEKAQNMKLLGLEIERLEHLQETTGQHRIQAQKALSDAPLEKKFHTELETFRQNLADKEKHYGDLSQEIKSWQEALKNSFTKLSDTRKQLHQQELHLLQIKGEAAGLERSLDIPSGEEDASLFNALKVDPDYSHALAIALNEGLNATLVSNDSLEKKHSYKRAWRELPQGKRLSPPLEGLQTLADFVKAPPALSRALNAIYILEDTSQAPALQARLSSGTSLISRDGSLWRWDGYVQSSEVPSSESQKLRSLQRLRELRSQGESLEDATNTVRTLLDDEQNNNQNLQAKIETHRDEAISLERDLSQLRFQIKEREHSQELSDKRRHYAQTQLDEIIASETDIKNHIDELKETLSELNHDTDEGPAEEQKVIELREAALQAHNQRAEAYTHFSTMERHYTQSQLHSDNTQSRLKDISAAFKHIETDFQTLSEQKKNFEDELSQMNLAETQRQLTEQQTELNNKLATLSQRETHYQALQADYDRAHNKLTILTQQQSASLGRRDTLRQQVKTQQELCLSLAKNLKDAVTNLQELPPLEEETKKLETLQIKFETNRLSFQENRATYEALEQKTRSINEKIQVLSAKLQTIEHDKTRLFQEIHELNQKKQVIEFSQQSQENPTQLAQQVEDLKATYDTLKVQFDESEQRLSSLAKALEASRAECVSLQDQHATIREKSSGLSERLLQAQNQLEQIKTQEPLPSPSENPLLQKGDFPGIGFSGKSELSLRRDISTFRQERDQLGSVNLKAETEHDSARKEADDLTKELSELNEAISKQQKIVSTINREGRARLNAVFADVDHHFQTLFARVFGGGKAHLAMIGSDDPLEAGLEIYAQPPGKKLSTLSLLSGGEQALTALSLIFAAFFCNPAPICILDEIDAPLDEANVEQFCRLIIDINKQTDTRFLVVTHHQVTMAHMNQLYGVTMQERGVSRVLSVNLSDSSQFIGS